MRDEPTLLWKLRAPPNAMAVHKDNRGGLGVSVAQACTDGLKHCVAGYSFRKACDGAWAVATLRGDEVIDACANQGLPPLLSSCGMSFGASHQNTFLRCVLARLEIQKGKLAPTGRLDPSWMMQKWPGLKNALESGIEWTFIHPAVAKRWPDIVRIGQKALNNRGTSEVSEIEGLLTIYEGYNVAVSNGKDEHEAWEASLVEAQRSDPFWSTWGKSLLSVCKTVSSEQVSEISEMKKVVAKTPEGAANTWGSLGGSYLSRVASLKWPGVVQFQRVRAAALTTNIMSPLERIVDGKCCLLKAGDLTALTDKNAKEDMRQTITFSTLC